MHYEIYTWTLCHSYLHEKQTSRIQSLYLYFIKIVPFWQRNIRFLIQNTRSLFYGGHYSSLHRLMSLHGKMDVKIFPMFIVAEYTRSVNIVQYFKFRWKYSHCLFKSLFTLHWHYIVFGLGWAGSKFRRLRFCLIQTSLLGMFVLKTHLVQCKFSAGHIPCSV